MIHNVLFADVETTGLQPPEHEIIEIGCILWNVKYRSILECYSALFQRTPPNRGNPAERWNGIHAGAMDNAVADREIAWSIVGDMAERADAIVAHSAVFDFKFVSHELGTWPDRDPDAMNPILQKPWICTLEDLIWPNHTMRAPGTGSLVQTALAHGVAVTNAHRSIHDCLLLARLFEAIDDIDRRLEAALVRAQRPKATYIALTEYEQKDLVKAHGFHWNGEVWSRFMAVEDAEALPFQVESV